MEKEKIQDSSFPKSRAIADAEKKKELDLLKGQVTRPNSKIRSENERVLA
ncbi:hypothetical protein CCACVL1_30341 [Corchorus capsularis]|uniref:Uncharacterized protein n=1 Tax=Corchorus capsularis TaxID=210143 RepID=A0A1R3FY16_COCAP|nr:hypothetical protein CCACVL1_30341 [Corchorus capsularis]